jgi:hypothetical protein
MHPDENGDALMVGVGYELSRCLSANMPVRILIHEHASPHDVARFLEKVASLSHEWIDEGMPAVDEDHTDIPF